MTNLDGFEVLTKIKNLQFSDLLDLRDFKALSKLNNLEYLTIKNCSIADLSELIDMENLSTPKNLKYLNITDVQTLGKLDCLSDETTYKVFSNLTRLTLNNCGVSSCSYFEKMTQLTYLDLRNNTIGTNGNNLGILESLHNTRDGALTELYLTGNVGLKGTIENHSILKLKWNNTVWET